MKFVKGLLYFVLVLYVIACACLYIIQDQLIFRPSPLPASHQYREGKEVKLKVADDVELSCYYKKEKASRGVILYLHGNKGNIKRCISQSNMMANLGYDIFMPDYRGYGKSEGQLLNENQMYNDIQIVYDHLKKQYKESQIIVVGYSIGTGMATYLAAHNKPSQLFLVAPYKSIADLKNRHAPFIPSFLLKFKFRNDKLIKDVSCPTTIFHADNDRVIPYDSSIYLKEIRPDIVDMIDLGDAGHRRSIFSNTLRQTLKRKIRA